MGYETTYKISVQTSADSVSGGTNSTVSFNLIGEDGCSTGYITLDNYFRNDFKAGRKDDFTVQAKDVGLPIIVRIRLTAFLGMQDEWLCDQIIVRKDDEEAIFPVYDWVVDELEVTRGAATLPQKVRNKYIIDLRYGEVERNKVTFAWAPYPSPEDLTWDLPLHVNAKTYEELPLLFQRSTTRHEAFLGKKLMLRIDSTMKLLSTDLVPLTSLDSYHRLYQDSLLGRKPDESLADWKTDESFGRQVLTGINPLMVWRCTEVPSHFNVTNDDVKTLLEGKNLEDEMKEGKVYISDYVDILSGLTRNPYNEETKYYCANSVALFHVNSEGTFLPIAIQLVPGDRDYLFTPADREDDWLLAKMYFRASSTSYHEWFTHLFLTHVITEPFSVALFRDLPRCHPIYKLMRPHMRTVSAINTVGRNTLIPPHSATNTKAIAVAAESGLKACFKNFTMDDLVIPRQFKKQGTHDRNLLPTYYYRDDALVLWDIMERFVSKVIRHFYKSDKDVLEDFELQGFARDVAKIGIGWQTDDSKGMPDRITSVDKLVEICTSLMFTSSGQHAAVNFGQYQVYKFVPNAPSTMNLPPHKKGEATPERILKTLPNNVQSIAAIAVAHSLSEYSPDETYVGEYVEQLFVEEEITEFQEVYRRELKEAGEFMKQRNTKLSHPYTYLLPENVPNGIAI